MSNIISMLNIIFSEFYTMLGLVGGGGSYTRVLECRRMSTQAVIVYM